MKRDEGSCIKQDYSPSRTEYMIQSFLFRVKEGEVGSGWGT